MTESNGESRVTILVYETGPGVCRTHLGHQPVEPGDEVVWRNLTDGSVTVHVPSTDLFEGEGPLTLEIESQKESSPETVSPNARPRFYPYSAHCRGPRNDPGVFAVGGSSPGMIVM